MNYPFKTCPVLQWHCSNIFWDSSVCFRSHFRSITAQWCFSSGLNPGELYLAKPYTKRAGSMSGGLHCKIRSLLFCSSVHLSESHHLLLRNPQNAVKPVTVFYTQPLSAPFLWATASWIAVINWVGLLAVFTSVHWGTSTRLTLGRTSIHRGKFVWSMTSSTKCLLCCSSLCTTLIS